MVFMKLFYCLHCEDLLRCLPGVHYECECGASTAYLEMGKEELAVDGLGIEFEIDAEQFVQAVRFVQKNPDQDHTFYARVMPIKSVQSVDLS